jgi:hypothetical protein
LAEAAMTLPLNLITILLVGIPCLVQAQNVNERDLLPSAVQLINSSDADLSFRVSYLGDSSWTRYHLAKREIKLIKVKDNDHFVIEICTGGEGNRTRCRKYRLEKSHRYQIYWNEAHSLWDLAEVTSE